MHGCDARPLPCAYVETYCSRCGGSLSAPPPTACSACGYVRFLDAKPCAGTIVVDDGRYLALLRSGGHGTGTWGVPGGFCDGEHPEPTAIRETVEETGLEVRLGELVGIYTDFYESQGDRFPTLHLYYLAAAAPSAQLRLAPDEASDARWVAFDDEPGPWAFPHLGKVVADAAQLAAKAPPRWSEADAWLRGR